MDKIKLSKKSKEDLEYHGIKYTPYKKTDEDRRAEKFEKQWGVPYSVKLKFIKNQGGVCAICRGLDRRGIELSVDHCHETGKIRGLLCGDCNFALGNFKDNIESLYMAARYLKKSRNIPTRKTR